MTLLCNMPPGKGMHTLTLFFCQYVNYGLVVPFSTTRWHERSGQLSVVGARGYHEYYVICHQVIDYFTQIPGVMDR